MRIGIPSDYVDIDTIGPAIDMMISLYKRYKNDLNRLKFSIRSKNYFNSGTPKLVFSLHPNLHICGYPDITNMPSDARLLCDIAEKILPAFEKALASGYEFCISN